MSEETVTELIPNDDPGAERKGSFKRKKGAGVSQLALRIKKLKYETLNVCLNYE